MNQQELEKHLQNLPLGSVRFFERLGSTNDMATSWIKAGCPDLALVVADEQTTGRGRGGRKWFSPAGSALAFSLVLRSEGQIKQLLKFQTTARLNGLGALAVTQATQKKYALPTQIKWPNDVIHNGQKFSGVLTEAHWIGNEISAVILGIGINVSPASIPSEDWDTFNPWSFPATSLETALGASVNRWELLFAVLEELLTWHKQLSQPDFLRAWETNLAYRRQWVQVIHPSFGEAPVTGKIIGLEEDGALRIADSSGEVHTIRSGEIYPSDSLLGGFRLRPVDSSGK